MTTKAIASAEAEKNEKNYQSIFKRVITQMRQVEGANLKRYRAIGALFVEFSAGVDAKKYGSRTVDTLAADLKNNGMFPPEADVKRFLYWAKNITDVYTDEQIEGLAQIGFTVSHVKQLLSLDDKVRQEIEQKMIRDGEVIPTRELAEMLKEYTRGQNKLALDSAMSEEAIPEPTPVAEGESADVSEESKPVVYTGEEAEKKAAEATAQVAEQADKRAELVKREVDPLGLPPLSKMDRFEKAMDSAYGILPDIFILVKEANKGFDSEKAQHNFTKKIKSLEAVVKSILDPLMNLNKALTELNLPDITVKKAKKK